MYNNSGLINPYLTNIGFFVLILFCYKKSAIKTIIAILEFFILFLLSELAYVSVLTFLFDVTVAEFNGNFIGYLCSNLIIFLIALLISKEKHIRKIFQNIVSWYNKNELKSLVIFVFFALTISIFILYNNFFKLLPDSILLFTNLFCIGVMVFVVGFFREKSNNNRIVSEYDQLLKYVTKYEKVIDEKSKNQHEYKNQLELYQGLVPALNVKPNTATFKPLNVIKR